MHRAYWTITLLLTFCLLAACASVETGVMVEAVPTAMARSQPSYMPIPFTLTAQDHREKKPHWNL